MEYIKAKSIVTRTKSTAWFGAQYNMNIYKGCCHGCIYCDSRSQCYRIENFDNVRAKEDALKIIRDDLRKKVKTGVISTGAMSDPYNKFEKDLCLTRHALELIDAYEFGIAIATKSSLITRDIDILKDIQKHSPVICKITITTYDDELCKKIEPNVSLSSERFKAIEQLSKAGIFSGILLMPVLPFIEDNQENILNIINMANKMGARFIYPAFGMTLRQNQREYYLYKLEKLFPQKDFKEKYIKTYGNAYQCTSKNAKKLWYIFKEQCDKYGILYNMNDIIKAYKSGYEDIQLKFFD